jgi:putative endonuclease
MSTMTHPEPAEGPPSRPLSLSKRTPSPTTARPDRRAFGQLGERLALQHLHATGYHIRETNYRCGADGEIDIIAEQNDTIVFIEVKSRRGSRMGTATEAVTPRKAQRLIALAETYAADHTPDAPLRIDIIAIDFTPDGKLLSLNHYENAVIGE